MLVRKVLRIAFPLSIVLGCAGGESVDLLPSEDAPAETEREATVDATPRMIALARILSGSWVENEWFSPEDIELTARLEFPGGETLGVHDEYFDTVDDPARCSVFRSAVGRDGSRRRPERVEIGCDEFWREVGVVDRYFELNGFLPRSAMDIQVFFDPANIEFESRE